MGQASSYSQKGLLILNINKFHFMVAVLTSHLENNSSPTAETVPIPKFWAFLGT